MPRLIHPPLDFVIFAVNPDSALRFPRHRPKGVRLRGHLLDVAQAHDARLAGRLSACLPDKPLYPSVANFHQPASK